MEKLFNEPSMAVGILGGILSYVLALPGAPCESAPK